MSATSILKLAGARPAYYRAVRSASTISGIPSPFTLPGRTPGSVGAAAGAAVGTWVANPFIKQYNRMMRKILKLVSGLKLGIILITLISILSIFASLLPQNQEPAYYKNHFPFVLSWLILFFHFDRYFTSLLFIIPAVLLFINLSFCTFNRLMKRIKNQGRMRSGPDVIHIGLLIILLGGLTSFFSRTEYFDWFFEDQGILITDHHYLKIDKIRYEEYRDGRAKDYVTKVEIFDIKKRIKIKECIIRVNQPLRMGFLYIYQYSLLWDEESKRPVTGLKFIKDYGIIPIWIGIAFLTVGLFWTYIQKVVEKKV